MNSLYRKNRSKVLKALKDGLILLQAREEILRNGKVAYPYRQDSYFLYLTGIDKPGFALVLDPADQKSHLFIPDMSEHHRVWVGRPLDVKEAKHRFGMAHVHYHSELGRYLKRLGKKYKRLYMLPSGGDPLKKYKVRLKKDTKRLKTLLDHMRLFKEPEEVALIQRANRISRDGHLAAMRAAGSARHEYEVQAELQKCFLKAGAPHSAYGAIVAAGRNAAILHYTDNNGPLKKTDLILIDAGCEWQGYASDVTRTFPIGGRFSKKQRAVYEIVLATQRECIRMIKPGVSFIKVHNYAARRLIDGLIRLGLIKDGDKQAVYKSGAHRLFFPHGIGHLLGLDVHDVGARPSKRARGLRSAVTLRPGMVVTIEPGIYFNDAQLNDPKVRKKFGKYVNWKKVDQYLSVGGVRIEDDILVTKTGHTNLTRVPKSIGEIEKVMRSQGRA